MSTQPDSLKDVSLGPSAAQRAFGVFVRRIEKLEPIPFAKHLAYAYFSDGRSVVYPEDFYSGQLAVWIPAEARLPAWLLKRLGLWNEKTSKGNLAGPQGDLVLPGHKSSGLCIPVKEGRSQDRFLDATDRAFHFVEVDKAMYGVMGFIVREGDEVSRFLGIRPYAVGA